MKNIWPNRKSDVYSHVSCKNLSRTKLENKKKDADSFILVLWAKIFLVDEYFDRTSAV